MSKLVTDSVEDFIAGRYRIVDEPADDLVTEEMVDAASYELARWSALSTSSVRAALRAVAPLIAALAVIDKGYRDLQAWRDGNEAGRAAEREAIAKIVTETEGWDDCLEASNHILAAIRARGETPPKPRRPGEIDWSATDKD
jgi:hypothetical protein